MWTHDLKVNSVRDYVYDWEETLRKGREGNPSTLVLNDTFPLHPVYWEDVGKCKTQEELRAFFETELAIELTIEAGK